MFVRRAAAVVLVAIEVGLAAVVVWGMVTGAHTQRAKTQVTVGLVAAVLGLGVASLIVLGVALVQAVRLWRSPRLSAYVWFAAAVVVWLVWALCRVIEDSS